MINQKIKKLIKITVFIGFTFNSVMSLANDWADDWLSANASYSGSSTYNGGGRSFITAGNLQFRANSSVSYPISMSAPRMKGGCGGVDMFLGGMSFMDVDMLVDKFEQMIQNGEVIAFQMAIKALSEKLGVTTESIQNVMDMLNGLQLDSCAMAKSAIQTVVVDDGNLADAAKSVWGEISQGQELSLGSVKNAWQKGKNNEASKGAASSSTNFKQEIASCPSEIKEILSNDGSIIERIAGIYGMSAYSGFIRGYVGDVITDHDSVNGNMPMVKKISPCSQNETMGIDDLVYGRAYEKRAPTGLNDPYTDAGQGCTQTGATNLIDYSRTQLIALSDALKDPTVALDPTSSLSKWADNAPMSVKAAMKLANDAGITNQVITEMSETLAYAYAFRIFDDMYRNTLFMFSTINDKLASATSDAVQESTNTVSGVAAPKCNLNAYVVTIKNLSNLRDQIADRHRNIRESYVRQNENFQAQLSQISRYQEIEKRKFSNAGVNK